jgi:hypothetical protein
MVRHAAGLIAQGKEPTTMRGTNVTFREGIDELGLTALLRTVGTGDPPPGWIYAGVGRNTTDEAQFR